MTKEQRLYIPLIGLILLMFSVILDKEYIEIPKKVSNLCWVFIAQTYGTVIILFLIYKQF